MDKRLQRIHLFRYIAFDFIAASLAWFFFISFRKANNNIGFGTLKEQLFIDENLIVGLLAIPLFWLILYYVSGAYKSIFRTSRLGQFGQTLFTSVIGVLVIFFVVLLDQEVSTSSEYYRSFLFLLVFHFFFTATFRLILTTILIKKIHNRVVGFRTIIIGSQKKAFDIIKELESQKKSSGNKLIGYVNVNIYGKCMVDKQLPRLGWFKDLKDIIDEHQIEEAILAIEPASTKTSVKYLPNFTSLMWL
jgi:FlaA1/EpsC-like NDP-sugar epimerase